MILVDGDEPGMGMDIIGDGQSILYSSTFDGRIPRILCNKLSRYRRREVNQSIHGHSTAYYVNYSSRLSLCPGMARRALAHRTQQSNITNQHNQNHTVLHSHNPYLACPSTVLYLA